MIKWFKRNQSVTENDNDAERENLPVETALEPLGRFARIKQSLTKTRQHLGEGVARLFLGKKTLDADLFESLETLLVSADVGIKTTQTILAPLTAALSRNELADGDAALRILRQSLINLFPAEESPLTLTPNTGSPYVVLMVGINGAGKTTTIAKLAAQFQAQGLKVMLAAGDTFRAAAIEQLQAWGERQGVPVIAQHKGADSASVAFDAYQAAKARGIDVLIVDTAGRLHTQSHLMAELQKIKRVLQKACPEAPHETMLVLDASIGQNALVQAREFHHALGVTGITMTKLDGTAKGGILFAISAELQLPFRYLGVGETAADLRPFNASQFVDAIFESDA